MACDRFCLKTSGKTGLHIVLPLDATYTYDEIRMFSRLIMQIVHQMIPDTTSTIRTPGKRKGKIYLDYLQNRFGQTLACAYSLRPFPQAPVSTPIEWHELRTGFKTDNFNIKTISKRIKEKGDLWKPILGKGIDLREAITRLQRELGKK
jgi:bifunctional non-homologous end joining protein LigD